MLQHSSWPVSSADGGLWSILHRNPPNVNPGSILRPPAACTCASSVHRRPAHGAVIDAECDTHACSSSAHISHIHDDPPWDSHEHDGFQSSHTYNQLVVKVHDQQPYVFGASWTFSLGEHIGS